MTRRRKACVKTSECATCQFTNVVSVVLQADSIGIKISPVWFESRNNDLHLLFMFTPNPSYSLLFTLNNIFVLYHCK